MNIVYDIPYRPTRVGLWILTVEGDESLLAEERLRVFSSRQQALAFAVSEATWRDPTSQNAMINIEGADGKWRAFRQSILPV